MKSKIILFIALTSLMIFEFGCFGNEVAIKQERYKKVCASWLNHDINELVRSWGPPSNLFDMPNGNKVYSWYRGYTQTNPVVTLPSTTTYRAYGKTVYQRNPMTITTGGDTVTYYCNTSFEVNASGIIVYWRFQGNACLAK